MAWYLDPRPRPPIACPRVRLFHAAASRYSGTNSDGLVYYTCLRATRPGAMPSKRVARRTVACGNPSPPSNSRLDAQPEWACGLSGTKYLLMSSCGSDPCPFGGKHACVCDADGRDGDILIRVIGPGTYGSRPEGQDKFARASTLVFESTFIAALAPRRSSRFYYGSCAPAL